MMKLRNKVTRLNIQNLFALAHQYNFTIFLELKTFAKSLYNGSLSLKVAKLKQRNMEDMIYKIILLQSKKKKLWNKKIVLHNAIEF